MHGEVKVRNEGLRTRDGHLLEWMAKAPGLELEVLSRPEPWPRLTVSRIRHPAALPSGWTLMSAEPAVLPGPGNRRRWWVDSLRHLPLPEGRADATLIWNPLAGAHLLGRGSHGTLALDLLDDWTVHPSFLPIRREVLDAYRLLMDRATVVTANGEGTVALAHSFGRTDAVLLPNGCDPDRFALPSTASGVTTIGYAGKLSHRLDVGLVAEAAAAMPSVQFVLAGPIIDRAVVAPLRKVRNIALIGDVRYDRYPRLLNGWDIGWVPHRVGAGELGGDIIKQYEFRAAGLPTFSTPLRGAHRYDGEVRVFDRSEMVAAMKALVDTSSGPRVPREHFSPKADDRWQTKARRLLDLMGISGSCT